MNVIKNLDDLEIHTEYKTMSTRQFKKVGYMSSIVSPWISLNFFQF